MKEIILRLEDGVAGPIAEEAKRKGMTSEELCKYVLGTFAQQKCKDIKEYTQEAIKEISEAFDEVEKHMFGKISNIRLKIMKSQARDGALTCKECTMRLSEQDIDNGKCGLCGAPIDLMVE